MTGPVTAPVRKQVRTLLVANRGEIARRVIRTAREMGIRTVAVYASGDAGAPFVAEADAAFALGGRTAAESYLDVSRLLAAARASGADAVHPGYGFLSESAGFAEAVVGSGLVWVGPPPAAIRAMADKEAAKALMRATGVPTLEVGGEVSYPVLVKASAGGGGRGMRVVGRAADLDEALASASREAEAAFGDGRVFLEPYVTSARHVEVQVLADRYGNVVHCFERECSIQRRHQKLVEESPSTGVSEALREEMLAAAVAAAKAVGYEGAGTVEFLVAAERFFFLEMNTRLQVEHPVTEERTGLDLVREQIRLAEGEPLFFEQADLVASGHAIEARLCAEDPANGFLPTAGTLDVFAPPPEPRLRWECGVVSGSAVGVEFDPMIAKVIAVAPTRPEAALRLAAGLEKLEVVGVVTNCDYLVAVLRSDEFLAGDTTTDFVERVRLPRRRPPSPAELHQAAVAAALFGTRPHPHRALPSLRPGWRNSALPPQSVTYLHESGAIEVAYRFERDGTALVWTGRPSGPPHRVLPLPTLPPSAGTGGVRRIAFELEGARVEAGLRRFGHKVVVRLKSGLTVPLEESSRLEGPSDVPPPEGALTAPMPGKVTAVKVEKGDRVRAGHVLVVVEAMKMEHPVACPAGGVVVDVHVAVGQQVDSGDVLAVVVAASKDGDG